MYLLTIHVPIYVDGPRSFVTTEWRRSLELLRDSFHGRFGTIQVLAPRLDANGVPADQDLESIDGSEGIALFPSFDRDCRARDYWLTHRRRWVRDIRTHIDSADVVHSGFCDVYRPINFAGHLEGVRCHKPTVFVQDTDQVRQLGDLAQGQSRRVRLKSAVYCAIYERCVRHGVRTASLSLLKGRDVMARFAAAARNPQCFQDTSHRLHEIVGEGIVEERLSALHRGRPLRLVYCGRLDKRKGVADSIAAVRHARSAGAKITFDVIGDGPERKDLEAQRGPDAEAIRFLGRMRYGRELIQGLADYDALLFTPTAEDTPRMIFDGYAAGLPLVGAAIPYVQERAAEDQSAILLPRRDPAMAGEILARLAAEPSRLAAVTRTALMAARHHAAEEWYRRRAEWTIEAVERHRAGG